MSLTKPMIPRPAITSIAAFIALTLSAQSLFAADANINASEQEAVTWYQVEVLLFKNNKEYKQDKNDITLNISSPDEQYVLVKGEPMVANQLKRLPNDSLTLNKSFRAITRSNDFEVLEFAGWKQPLIKGQTGTPLTIKVGEKFGEHYELEGQLTFRKKRYLHIKADLYMANYEEDMSSNLQEWLLEDEFNAPSFTSVTNTTSNLPDTRERQESIINSEENVTNYIASDIAHMYESRRMRSGEIHFLDHPKFGILVTIEPTDPPFVYNERSESSNPDFSPAGEH